MFKKFGSGKTDSYLPCSREAHVIISAFKRLFLILVDITSYMHFTTVI